MHLRTPTVAVVIPTLNEECSIGGLLENLKRLGPDEVIVADGESTDRTLAIAARHVRTLAAPRGRALQMNAGARASSGDILLFLHADVRLAPGAIEAVRRAMREPLVVGGNFDIRYEEGDWTARAFTQINRCRRRLGVFYGDSGIFCQRAVFAALGGFRSWPILEDYDFARRLRQCGKLALLDEPIWVSDRRWRSAGLVPTMWSWFWIQGLYLAGVSPFRLASLYPAVRPSQTTVCAAGFAPASNDPADEPFGALATARGQKER
ncbi:MAG TPA: TIGR04283 family arsenosugar biosynthesis glycosyltransferase [Terriglobia bacterium]|nr:TIGR04283 family arsenosugar biosynthesis glycosyltransferase [Terriglobia bacterium]